MAIVLGIATGAALVADVVGLFGPLTFGASAFATDALGFATTSLFVVVGGDCTVGAEFCGGSARTGGAGAGGGSLGIVGRSGSGAGGGALGGAFLNDVQPKINVRARIPLIVILRRSGVPIACRLAH